MSARSLRRNRERVENREAGRARRLLRRGTVATSAALGAGALFASAADAVTFPVNDLDDHDDGDCSASDCTLREAILDANDTTAADIVTFAAGLSGEIVLDGGGNVYMEEPVDIQGPGASVITVSGDGHPIFYAKTFGEPVTISGLTLRDGYADSSYDTGGAVEVRETDLTIADSVLTENQAYFDGGAVYVDGGSLVVTGSVFSDNSTIEDDGGALMVDDDSEEPSTIAISDSVFTGNRAGVALFEGDAGAIYIDAATDSALIERTTVSGNTAEEVGGGIVADSSLEAPLTIEASTISGNSAEVGGGIFLYALNDPVTIQNSTVSGNSAEYAGGGIHFDGDSDDDEQITVRNSTVAGNEAGYYGGGINRDAFYSGGNYYSDTVHLSSTIVADNTAGEENPDLGEDPTDDPQGFEVGFSLVEDPGIVNVIESPAGSNIFGVDPQLGGLANNGGPTQTHRPAATSPAIDAGIANGLSTDQRGLARTFDAVAVANRPGSDGTDIGSVEVQAGEGGLPGNAQCQGATVPEFKGTEGNDTLTGTPGSDFLRGLGGADAATGAAGNDCVNGDAGKDNAKGGPGKDIVKGGGGGDKASGGGGKDKVKGNAGKDKLKGGGCADKLSGAGGKDKLKGGGGKDRLKGGPGKDKLSGGGGKDRFNCGGGTDKVTAQEKDKVSANCEKVVEKG